MPEDEKPKPPVVPTPPTSAPPPVVPVPSSDDTDKKALEKERKALKKENDAYLIDNNKLLMKGTSFNDKYFEGMDLRAINTFLKNRQAQDKKKEGASGSSNTPIVGTPIGSSQGKKQIDKFLTIDTKNSMIKFRAPASEVFKSFANHAEAKKHWLADS